MTASLRDIWRDNPRWAKVLLAIAIGLFLLEVIGVLRDVGLAALNLTAIAFLFSMNRTLGEASSTLERMASTLTGLDSTLTEMTSTFHGLDSTITEMDSTLTGIESTFDGMDSTITEMDSTLTGIDSTLDRVDSKL